MRTKTNYRDLMNAAENDSLMSLVEDLLDDAHDEGYDEGYNEGHEVGYENGISISKEEQ